MPFLIDILKFANKSDTNSALSFREIEHIAQILRADLRAVSEFADAIADWADSRADHEENMKYSVNSTDYKK